MISLNPYRFSLSSRRFQAWRSVGSEATPTSGLEMVPIPPTINMATISLQLKIAYSENNSNERKTSLG